MTKLEFLKEEHQNWADKAGYKLSIKKRTKELWISSETGIVNDAYLSFIRHQDIFFAIDFNNKAIRIHELEYSKKAK